MNDRPDALELLRIANETLVQDILPEAKAEQLYTLRMIANALGIAARELEARARDDAVEAQGLVALYGPQASSEVLPALSRRFAADIRAGRILAPLSVGVWRQDCGHRR
jgi:hypothetical protein